MRGAFHQVGDDELRRAQRIHRRKHGLDANAERRLRIALETLSDMRETVERLLPEGDASATRVRAALRQLVDGPNGEFR